MSLHPAFPITLRLPHPYLTTYRVAPIGKSDTGIPWLRLFHDENREDSQGQPLTSPLHNNVSFTLPKTPSHEESPPASNNTFWARIRRSPKAEFLWDEYTHVTVAQLWLHVYAIFTLQPGIEHFRLKMSGLNSDRLAEELKAVSLAVDHPAEEDKDSGITYLDELVIIRSTFWQGAGSPFGARPVWAPDTTNVDSARQALSAFPLAPVDYTVSTKFPQARIHSFHPRRPRKPTPGALIYSRYIPHLDEHFSMVALDFENDEHLQLFHQWQNDPRVSAGWNETGTLDQHRQYLRNLHEDPHTLTVLARFDDNFFAYYEVYWAKEDHFGVYCDAGDFDRGRHSLVGDVRFRGSHRVSAWWSSLMHYIFLDDPRTMFSVGEPKATNTTVLSYDLMCGFAVEKLVDLPHKRSAFVKCSRERFFQLCPLTYDGTRVVGGTSIPLFTKAKL